MAGSAVTRDNLQSAKIDSTGTTIALVAGTANKKVRLLAIFFNLASSTTFKFQSASTDLTGAMTGTEFKLDFSDVEWFETAAGEALNLTLGGEVQCSGRVYYTVED